MKRARQFFCIGWTLLVLIGTIETHAQGHIDHIKNQPYMKMASKVNCQITSDALSSRICANLAYQHSDSLLTIQYNYLLANTTTSHIDSVSQKIIRMQATWRQMRDQHCGLVYDTYEGCGGCNDRATAYLECLRELTNMRTEELKRLRLDLK